MTTTVPMERITNKIYLFRDQKVMLDRDLAELYDIETKILKRAVRRNIDRFPNDFMFQLSKKEMGDWRCQFGTSNGDKMGLRYAPMAFTEQGVAMLSSVLNSKRAIQVNIQIMRTFTRLRQMLSTHKELAGKLSELERRLEGHDEKIQVIFQAIKQLMTSPEKPRKKIGFIVKEKQRNYGRLKP
jgi:hypothetical protein